MSLPASTVYPHCPPTAWRRCAVIAVSALLLSGAPALAQVSVGVELPGVSIGINVPLYPRFERVPNFPVYYAPDLPSNYFFYDGMYWVYESDDWYASTWYDGPWHQVQNHVVPVYLLRIPVRYYRSQPAYFRGWEVDAPPRWGTHWGPAWQRQRNGWDRWDRRGAPPPAPLPTYQQHYSADRYPRSERQQELRRDNYRYRPREGLAQQQFGQPPEQSPRPALPRAVIPDRRSQDSQPPAHQPRQGRSDQDHGRPSAPAPLPREGRRADTDTNRLAPGQGAAMEPQRERGRGREPERGDGRGRDKDREQDRDKGR